MINLVISIAALGIAVFLLPNARIEGDTTSFIKTLLLANLVLGIANSFLRPIINFIAFPIKLLTMGLFELIINMGLIWGVDILFPNLYIVGIFPLLWAALILWTLLMIFNRLKS